MAVRRGQWRRAEEQPPPLVDHGIVEHERVEVWIDLAAEAALERLHGGELGFGRQPEVAQVRVEVVNRARPPSQRPREVLGDRARGERAQRRAIARAIRRPTSPCAPADALSPSVCGTPRMTPGLAKVSRFSRIIARVEEPHHLQILELSRADGAVMNSGICARQAPHERRVDGEVVGRRMAGGAGAPIPCKGLLLEQNPALFDQCTLFWGLLRYCERREQPDKGGEHVASRTCHAADSLCVRG